MSEREELAKVIFQAWTTCNELESWENYGTWERAYWCETADAVLTHLRERGWHHEHFCREDMKGAQQMFVEQVHRAERAERALAETKAESTEVLRRDT